MSTPPPGLKAEIIGPQYGYAYAFAARKAAHPEVDALAAKEPMTFEEYSNFYSLDPAEPLGSRLDEFREHLTFTTNGGRLPHDQETLEKLGRLALAVGVKTFEAWQPTSGYTNHVDCISVNLYKIYVMDEVCAYVWGPHIASRGPYGPQPRHHFFSGDPRFELPKPPVPVLEPPVQRAATSTEAGEACIICRFGMIALGETITVLPCAGHPGHFFHPDCIDPWFEAVGQRCPLNCAQRVLPIEKPREEPLPEHNDYNYAYTFRDGPDGPMGNFLPPSTFGPSPA